MIALKDICKLFGGYKCFLVEDNRYESFSKYYIELKNNKIVGEHRFEITISDFNMLKYIGYINIINILIIAIKYLKSYIIVLKR